MTAYYNELKNKTHFPNDLLKMVLDYTSFELGRHLAVDVKEMMVGDIMFTKYREDIDEDRAVWHDNYVVVSSMTAKSYKVRDLCPNEHKIIDFVSIYRYIKPFNYFKQDGSQKYVSKNRKKYTIVRREIEAIDSADL